MYSLVTRDGYRVGEVCGAADCQKSVTPSSISVSARGLILSVAPPGESTSLPSQIPLPCESLWREGEKASRFLAAHSIESQPMPQTAERFSLEERTLARTNARTHKHTHKHTTYGPRLFTVHLASAFSTIFQECSSLWESCRRLTATAHNLPTTGRRLLLTHITPLRSAAFAPHAVQPDKSLLRIGGSGAGGVPHL